MGFFWRTLHHVWDQAQEGGGRGSVIGRGGVRGSALVCSGMAAGAPHHPQLIPQPSSQPGRRCLNKKLE